MSLFKSSRIWSTENQTVHVILFPGTLTCTITCTLKIKVKEKHVDLIYCKDSELAGLMLNEVSVLLSQNPWTNDLTSLELNSEVTVDCLAWRWVRYQCCGTAVIVNLTTRSRFIRRAESMIRLLSMNKFGFQAFLITRWLYWIGHSRNLFLSRRTRYCWRKQATLLSDISLSFYYRKVILRNSSFPFTLIVCIVISFFTLRFRQQQCQIFRPLSFITWRYMRSENTFINIRLLFIYLFCNEVSDTCELPARLLMFSPRISFCPFFCVCTLWAL